MAYKPQKGGYKTMKEDGRGILCTDKFCPLYDLNFDCQDYCNVPSDDYGIYYDGDEVIAVAECILRLDWMDG